MPAKLSLADFVRRIHINPVGCWEYRGPIGPTGYTTFGRQTYAHRFAYETKYGKIPAGLTVDHLCRVRHCVNPDHMEIVTGRVNGLRGMSFAAVNARKTHCVRGHPFATTARMISNRKGTPQRQCRTCFNAWRRAKKHGISVEAALGVQ